MAQTKRKRRTKHRGTAAGTVETRGRTSKANASAPAKKKTGSASKQTATDRRAQRLDRPPSWRGAINRSLLSAAILFLVLATLMKPKGGVAASIGLACFAAVLYVPLGYYMDKALYTRRQRQKGTSK